jgi:hypothetical protein
LAFPGRRACRLHRTRPLSEPSTGYCPPEVRRPLIEILRRHAADYQRCWAGVWRGWGGIGGVFPEIPLLKLPHREYYLFTVSYHVLGDQIFGGDTGRGISANLWWPADRSWFVATEIDFRWAYVGGFSQLHCGDSLRRPDRGAADRAEPPWRLSQRHHQRSRQAVNCTHGQRYVGTRASTSGIHRPARPTPLSGHRLRKQLGREQFAFRITPFGRREVPGASQRGMSSLSKNAGKRTRDGRAWCRASARNSRRRTTIFRTYIIAASPVPAARRSRPASSDTRPFRCRSRRANIPAAAAAGRLAGPDDR